MKRRPAQGFYTLAVGLVCSVLASACQTTGAAASKPPEVAIAEHPAGDSVVEDRVATAFDFVDDDAPVVGMLDAVLLRQGQLFGVLATVTAAVPGAAESLHELEEKCGFDPIHALTRAAFSTRLDRGGPNERTLVVAFEVDQPADAVFSCVQNLLASTSSGRIEATQVQGHSALSFEKEVYLVQADGVFLFGPKPSVERALKRRSSGLRLPEDAYLLVSASFDNQLGVERAQLQLDETQGGLRLSVSAQTDSPAAAEQLAQTVEQGRDLLSTRLEDSDFEDAQRGLFGLILQEVRIEHQGVQAALTLDVDGREHVSTLVGAMASLAIYGVRRYVNKAKAREARVNVAEIGLGLQRYAEGQGKGRLPTSAPPTPAAVPSGGKIQVEESAWEHPSWKAIGFAVEGGQYFSYQFTTAKDRKSAVIEAHGDLDGQGRVVVVESIVTVNQDGAVERTPPSDSSGGEPLLLPVAP